MSVEGPLISAALRDVLAQVEKISEICTEYTAELENAVLELSSTIGATRQSSVIGLQRLDALRQTQEDLCAVLRALQRDPVLASAASPVKVYIQPLTAAAKLGATSDLLVQAANSVSAERITGLTGSGNGDRNTSGHVDFFGGGEDS